jgi:U3 small nucleolar ribonucleoprotein protein IMP4
MEWDEGLMIDPGHIDDEYAKVGTYDPKIVITTSRSPSSRLLQFSKVSSSKHFDA